MNRRNLIGAFGAFSIGVLGLGFTKSATADNDTASPQSEAIALVIKKQQKEISEAEASYFKENGVDWWKGAAKQYRWHDTITRSWSSTRPVPPGVMDSTHLFDVVYSINNKSVASWSVDTRKKKIGLHQPIEFEPTTK